MAVQTFATLGCRPSPYWRRKNNWFILKIGNIQAKHISRKKKISWRLESSNNFTNWTGRLTPDRRKQGRLKSRGERVTVFDDKIYTVQYETWKLTPGSTPLPNKTDFSKGVSLKNKHENVVVPKERTNPVASSLLILPLDSQHIAELTCIQPRLHCDVQSPGDNRIGEYIFSSHVSAKFTCPHTHSSASCLTTPPPPPPPPLPALPALTTHPPPQKPL